MLWIRPLVIIYTGEHSIRKFISNSFQILPLAVGVRQVNVDAIGILN